ncbi:hypothetical protein CAEBREN_17851 [Caenorhabditis brenneri]|uniref:Uncharacterized protein n=1 Tax=Caenorhabditis brenneri TaxID=135651 RepID=G0NWD6_CAEBE|nr:hypothetical protein CAEBREN_17851 [Caenorhabditis brenneri]
MVWPFETANDVKKQCERDRITKANEAERNVRINVENHKNSGAAQLHQETIGMEAQKRVELDVMKQATQATLNELNDANFKTKRDIAEKSSKEKARVLQEHEAKIKQREQERDKAAREQSQRTEGLRKDQDEAIHKVEQLKKENLKEQIKELEKTSELQNEIFDAEKQLSEKHDREFHETEKKAYEDHLQVEKNFNDKAEEDYQLTHRDTQRNQQMLIERLSSNLTLRVKQSLSNDVKAVNSEITNAKQLATIIQTGLNESLELLVADMGKNERSQASDHLKKVQIDLSQLTDNVTSMERKAKKIVDQNIQTELQEAFTKIRKKINAAADPITDVKREMRSTKEFNEAKRDKMAKSVKAVIKLVGKLPQLNSGESEIRETIDDDQKKLTKQQKAIENVTEEN